MIVPQRIIDVGYETFSWISLEFCPIEDSQQKKKTALKDSNPAISLLSPLVTIQLTPFSQHRRHEAPWYHKEEG